jgi:hypothetical protein
MPRGESWCGLTPSGAIGKRSQRSRWPPASDSAATSQEEDVCTQYTWPDHKGPNPRLDRGDHRTTRARRQPRWKRSKPSGGGG